jgi:hypothetical protein
MTEWKPCKFFQDANCTIKHSFCDLNCNQRLNGEDIHFPDENNPFTPWKVEDETGMKPLGIERSKN